LMVVEPYDFTPPFDLRSVKTCFGGHPFTGSGDRPFLSLAYGSHAPVQPNARWF
jgi:hypothetical protein